MKSTSDLGALRISTSTTHTANTANIAAIPKAKTSQPDRPDLRAPRDRPFSMFVVRSIARGTGAPSRRFRGFIVATALTLPFGPLMFQPRYCQTPLNHG